MVLRPDQLISTRGPTYEQPPCSDRYARTVRRIAKSRRLTAVCSEEVFDGPFESSIGDLTRELRPSRSICTRLSP